MERLVNSTEEDGGTSFQYLVHREEPLYREFQPAARDMVPLPRAALYLLMAAVVVLAVAYAIVGHLIKELILDIVDCLLGPLEETPPKGRGDLTGDAPPTPPPVPPSVSHGNAFHVWDQDDVVILPLTPPDDSPSYPQPSPLLAVRPYIPSFFPSATALRTSPHYAQPSPKEYEV